MQEVVSSLVEAQAQGVGGVIRSVPIGEGLPVISSLFVLCLVVFPCIKTLTLFLIWHLLFFERLDSLFDVTFH
jgi:hypothetical protein